MYYISSLYSLIIWEKVHKTIIPCDFYCWIYKWRRENHTGCPGSSDPFYVVTWYIKWNTTSWTHINRKTLFLNLKINKVLSNLLTNTKTNFKKLTNLTIHITIHFLGHSSNYIFNIYPPTKEEPAYWTNRGVAAICQVEKWKISLDRK